MKATRACGRCAHAGRKRAPPGALGQRRTHSRRRATGGAMSDHNHQGSEPAAGRASGSLPGAAAEHCTTTAAAKVGDPAPAAAADGAAEGQPPLSPAGELVSRFNFFECCTRPLPRPDCTRDGCVLASAESPSSRARQIARDTARARGAPPHSAARGLTQRPQRRRTSTRTVPRRRPPRTTATALMTAPRRTPLTPVQRRRRRQQPCGRARTLMLPLAATRRDSARHT